jgi:hypothetical protein
MARMSRLDRAAGDGYTLEDYTNAIDRLLSAESFIHRAAKGMNDDELYSRTMVACTALREVLNAFVEAEGRTKRENAFIRAVLGNA